MQHELNDIGGAKELAKYRLNAAKEDLAAAKNSLEQIMMISILYGQKR